MNIPSSSSLINWTPHLYDRWTNLHTGTTFIRPGLYHADRMWWKARFNAQWVSHQSHRSQYKGHPSMYGIPIIKIIRSWHSTSKTIYLYVTGPLCTLYPHPHPIREISLIKWTDLTSLPLLLLRRCKEHQQCGYNTSLYILLAVVSDTTPTRLLTECVWLLFFTWHTCHTS